MSKGNTSIADKQYLAKILFTREQLNQNVVAARVGISENTMTKWVKEFNWKALRQRLLLSKEDQLNALYEQLEALNKEIKDSDIQRPDTKQADVQVKITTSIRTLETDLAIADIVESGIRFIKFLQKTDCTLDELMDITDKWNSFIQASIKK